MTEESTGIPRPCSVEPATFMEGSVMQKGTAYFQSAIFMLGFLISTAAMAGTLFAPRAARDDSSNGDYPPSSFGEPPVNGFSQGFAAREVMDMDQPASRGLASVGESPISITQAA